MISKYLMAPLLLGLCLPALAQDAVTTVQAPGTASPPPVYPIAPGMPAPVNWLNCTFGYFFCSSGLM